MSFNSNPLGIAGPNKTANFVQDDFRTPSVSADVADYPVGWNVLDLTQPIARYTQPDYVTFAPTPEVFYPTVFWSS